MKTNMKENRLRGSAAYPIVLYEMPGGDTPLSAAPHWQEDVEVLAVEQGRVELVLDGTRTMLTAGDLIWINPGQIHSFHACEPKARCSVFIFPLEHLLFAAEDHDQQAWLRPLTEGRLGFPLRLPEGCGLMPLIRQAIQLQQDRPTAYELLTKALLVNIIARLAQAGALVTLQPRREEDTCKELLAYIQQHYMERLTVREAAQAAALSPTYFSAWFQRHFCCAFSVYLRHYRIEQACLLLTGSDRSVTEVGLAVGFSSGSHFIQAFRQVKGKTPLAYRRESGA